MTDDMLQVGPLSPVSDGAHVRARASKTGETVTVQGHGRYYEPASRGRIYCASVPTTGVAPGTTIGTAAAFTLANPRGSGKRLAVQRICASYVSGTLGVGALFLVASVNPQAAAVSGTALTRTCLSLGASAPSVGLAYHTATLPASPTLLRAFCCVTPYDGTANVAPFQVVEDTEGEIVIEPGCALSIEGVTAAGTSPLITLAMTWEEIPL